jgi:hypothetical protein
LPMWCRKSARTFRQNIPAEKQTSIKHLQKAAVLRQHSAAPQKMT